MLRYEKIDDGSTANYMLHIDHNYRLYIDVINGKAYYGIWSEIEKMNNPIVLQGNGEFEWDWRQKQFHLPKRIEEPALRQMKKLYAYYLNGGKEPILYDQLWAELQVYIRSMTKESEDSMNKDTEQYEYHKGRYETYGQLSAYMKKLLEANN
ncbi:hypothetical protein BK120_19805 [Paenibacillus sp. FSL A5-0031]|uniref:hypothetical protein n=1 Tax=Paenibacillus sp. FSL A5-0031 TaxID=1920420 RepID=UPI00096FF1F1|nr:hypothetical protein [Paenibacillus sp. FSL A5-0031]OME80088.1 hypothetical protein BK120_19805 [Paenibacillus sp. FSL A5-0031]